MTISSESIYKALFTEDRSEYEGPIFPDPDEVGETAYTGVYSIVSGAVITQPIEPRDNAIPRVLELLGAVASEALEMRARIIESLGDQIPQDDQQGPILLNRKDSELTMACTPQAIRNFFESDGGVDPYFGRAYADLSKEITDEYLRKAALAVLGASTTRGFLDVSMRAIVFSAARDFLMGVE